MTPSSDRVCSTEHSRAKAVAPPSAHSIKFSGSGEGPLAEPWPHAFSSNRIAALDVRIDMRFGLSTRMGHCALVGRADVLRIAPQRAGVVVVPARPPSLAPLGENRFVDLE